MAIRLVLSVLVVLGIAIAAQAQQTRYFQFTVACGHGNWQDTSFVAATNNQAVIDSILANLSRPLEERKFINGPIAAGNGGHNHNASHWFSWHFIPNEWSLVEFAIEVCDGCPYSDLDADTAYWFNTVGQFCPWSGQPLREISAPTAVEGIRKLENISVYPNPATNALYINHNYSGHATITLHDMNGELVYHERSLAGKMLNVRQFSTGIYWLTITIGQGVFTERIVITR